MYKILIITALLISLNANAFETKCFIAMEDNKIIKQNGEHCNERFSPCSTFNIAISLMGYDQNILIDKTKPLWDFQDGYVDFLEIWKQPHNPSLWMKNSTIWYSQLITKQLGIEKFKYYITKFDYGNQDVSDREGLVNAWLSSTLKISPIEQVKFLQKFNQHNLPVNSKATKMTKDIIYLEEFANGWKIFGKTGVGETIDQNKHIGWFVGWIEKNKQVIYFSSLIEQTEKDVIPSKKAKELAKELLKKLVVNSL